MISASTTPTFKRRSAVQIFIKATLLQMREEAENFEGDVQVELFSSLKGFGVDILERKIAQWYGEHDLLDTETAEESTEEETTETNE